MNTSENNLRVVGELAHLLDLVLDAIILRDTQGAIISWNRGAEKLLGWTREEALGKHAHTLLHTRFPQPLEAIEAEALRVGHWEGELVHIRRDGTPVVVTSRWAMWQQDPGAPLALVEISTDVTERKQVERSQRLMAEAGPLLAASLDATSRLANIARVVVPLLADWCVVHVTEEGQPIRPVAVAHADPQKLAQAKALLLRPAPDADAPPGAAQVLRTGQPELYPEASEALLAAIARDADQIELVRSLGVKSAMIVPLVTRGHTLGTITLVLSAESGRQYTEVDLALAEELARRAALAVDNARLYAEAQQLNTELEERVARRTAELQAAITQLENSRAQLLLLAQHEQIRREEDRARMAREVHDELGQALTGLKMDLAWLQKHTGPKQTDLLRKLRDMSDLVDTTIQGVRRIATELRPGMLDDLGLVPAMEWQLQEFQKRSEIRCGFTSSLQEVALNPEETIVLFRILQETLTNVARHASATQVEVLLDEEQGYVRLRVQDNGRGITESEVNGSKSFGLLGMRERVKLRSGDFHIKGTPGQGTTVVIKLPLIKGQEVL
ncbi:MAG: PAS domain S-box protein [Chloroflexota bacterium]|nr:PAS domain S-box protein [Chloroflexota bacterium]